MELMYDSEFDVFYRYLVRWEYDDTKRGFIVYVSDNNEAEWKDTRDASDFKKLKLDKAKVYSKLTELKALISEPHSHLPERDITDYMKFVGTAYWLALVGLFDEVEDVKDKANKFLCQRNKEYVRFSHLLILNVVVLFTALIVLMAYMVGKKYVDLDYVYGISMGVFGAYIASWRKYGEDENIKGYSKWRYFIESFSRLLVGAVFAVVALFAVNCGMLFEIKGEHTSVYAIVGFIAGFSENFIPNKIGTVMKNSFKGKSKAS